MSSEMKNDSKIWFITGASLGLGRTMTETVLKQGDIVVATVRRMDSLKDLQEIYSDRLLVLRLDVTQEDEISAAFAKVKEVFGRIDVVYNNAGYAVVGEVEAVPLAEARAVFDTNFWGAVSISRHAIAFLRDTNKPMGGRLLQASSMVGMAASGSLGYYCASKFALEGMTEALSKELDPAWNIKVTILEAGYYRTPALRDARYEIHEHPAYTNPAVEGVAVRQFLGNPESGASIKGDPVKLCNSLYKLTSLSEPPLRLVLGKDALGAIGAKLTRYEDEMKEYKAWSDDLEVEN